MATTQTISSSRAGLGSVVVTDPRGFIVNVGVVAAGDLPAASALFVDDDVIFAPVVTALAAPATLSPTLLDDADTICPVPSVTADAPGQGTQHLRPNRVSDNFGGNFDAIYSAALGRVLEPGLLADDGTIYAGSAVLVLRPALVASDDAVHAFTNTRFAQASLVPDDGAIPAADVGWHLFVDSPVTDVDQIFAVGVRAFNDLAPDVLVEDDDIRTYPFRVQSVTGGIPVPPPQGLTGSLSTRRVLTGSLSTRRVLTGSLGVRYGTLGKSIGKRR